MYQNLPNMKAVSRASRELGISKQEVIELAMQRVEQQRHFRTTLCSHAGAALRGPALALVAG